MSGTGICALNCCLAVDNDEGINILLEKKAPYFFEDINVRNSSPIFTAIRTQNITALEQFCDFGASLNVQNTKGETPLLFAAKNGYDSTVNYLSLRCKDLNMQDIDGHTILMHYIEKGSLCMVRKIIIRGGDVNFRNNSGISPIFHALRLNASACIVDHLLSHGADPHLENINGKDACDILETY